MVPTFIVKILEKEIAKQIADPKSVIGKKVQQAMPKLLGDMLFDQNGDLVLPAGSDEQELQDKRNQKLYDEMKIGTAERVANNLGINVADTMEGLGDVYNTPNQLLAQALLAMSNNKNHQGVARPDLEGLPAMSAGIAAKGAVVKGATDTVAKMIRHTLDYNNSANRYNDNIQVMLNTDAPGQYFDSQRKLSKLGNQPAGQSQNPQE